MFLCVVVVEIVEFLGDGGDLFDSVLVGGQVWLERLVLLDQSLQLRQVARSVVFRAKGFVLSKFQKLEINHTGGRL